MQDIIYDIAAGFVRFDTDIHAFKTVTGQKLRFTKEELEMIRTVFLDKDVRPRFEILNDTQILTYTTTDRHRKQYNEDVLRDRIHFYQQ